MFESLIPNRESLIANPRIRESSNPRIESANPRIRESANRRIRESANPRALIRKPAHPDVEDQSERGQCRNHRRAAVAHEGQGEPLHGRQARRHRDVVNHLEREPGNDASDQIGADAVLGQPGRFDRSENDKQVEAQRDENADEALLLRKDREDEIVVGNRQELVLTLRALPEALPLEAAGANRDPRLNLLIAAPARILFGIDERLDT